MAQPLSLTIFNKVSTCAGIPQCTFSGKRKACSHWPPRGPRTAAVVNSAEALCSSRLRPLAESLVIFGTTHAQVRNGTSWRARGGLHVARYGRNCAKDVSRSASKLVGENAPKAKACGKNFFCVNTGILLRPSHHSFNHLQIHVQALIAPAACFVILLHQTQALLAALAVTTWRAACGDTAESIISMRVQCKGYRCNPAKAISEVGEATHGIAVPG